MSNEDTARLEALAYPGEIEALVEIARPFLMDEDSARCPGHEVLYAAYIKFVEGLEHYLGEHHPLTQLAYAHYDDLLVASTLPAWREYILLPPSEQWMILEAARYSPGPLW